MKKINLFIVSLVSFFIYVCTILPTLHAKNDTEIIIENTSNNTLEVELFFENATCISSNGKAWIEVSQSTNVYTTLWSTGESNTDTIYNLPSGDYKVSITNGLDEVILSGTVEMEMPYELEWTKVYGGSANDIAFDVELTADGGYIVVGETRSNDGDISNHKGGGDFWVMKLNELGELEWEKNYGGSLNEGATSVIASDDGHFVIAGYSFSSDGDISNPIGGNDFWVIKIDENGNLIWDKNYGGSGHEGASEIDVTSDGGFYVIGTSGSTDGDLEEGNIDGGSAPWVLRLDENGNLLWSKTGPSGSYENGRFIRTALDDGYISGGDGYWDDHCAWMKKSDSTGEDEETTGFCDYNYTYLSFASEPTSDGGFLVIGNRWLLKLDKYFNIVWASVEVGNGFSSEGGVSFELDQDVITIGEEKIVASDKDKYYILDKLGNIKTSFIYGGSAQEKSLELKSTPDGGFIAVGYSTSNDGDVGVNYGAKDFWILKHSPIHFPEVNLEPSRLVCQNETIELNALDPLCPQCTYLWDDGNTESIREVTITEDIDFQVTITNPSGCFGVGNTQIIASSLSFPEIILAPVGTIDCEHPSIVIDGSTSTGTEFYWTTSDGYTCGNDLNTSTLEVCLPGTYCLTAVKNTSASTSCEVTECVTITENISLEVDLEIVPETCAAMNASATVTVLNGSGDYTYQWCDGQTTATATELSPGECFVTISDNNSCTIIERIEVEQIGLSSVTLIPMIETCQESNGSISSIPSGADPFSYQWSTGATTANITDLSAGIYTLTLTDVNNCELISSVEVLNDPIINIDIDVTNTFCFEEKGKILISPTWPSWTYVWDIGIVGPNIFNLAGGSYTITITNEDNCQLIETIVVQNSAEPNIDLGPDLPIAAGQTISIGLEQPTLTHLWSTSETTDQIEVSDPGVYSVTVTNGLGCTAVDEIEIFSLTATDELTKNNLVQINPNPVSQSQELNVFYQTDTAEKMQVQIVNVLGQILDQNEKQMQGGENQWSIDVSNYTAGIYFFIVKKGNEKEVIKFIKI